MGVTHIALIGCGKSKRPGSHPARDLYTGPLFRAAIAHAERTAERVFIVSACYGLLPLDRVVESYDAMLPLDAGERSAWAIRVRTALLVEIDMAGDARAEVTIYAGGAYANPLEAVLLVEHRIRVLLPLDGLTQGARLAWFKQRRAPQ